MVVERLNQGQVVIIAQEVVKRAPEASPPGVASSSLRVPHVVGWCRLWSCLPAMAGPALRSVPWGASHGGRGRLGAARAAGRATGTSRVRLLRAGWRLGLPWLAANV